MAVYSPGQVILTSKPFVHVLSNKERGKRCDECFRQQDKVQRCSVCQFSAYCSKTCQKSAWPQHKWECKALVRVAPNVPTDSVRLFYRILIKLQKYNGTEDCESAFEEKRTFDSLLSHASDMKKDETRLKDFMKLCHTLNVYTGESLDLPSQEEILEYFGKMLINSFSICDAEMQALGVGLYLGASVLDHSCSPNAVVVFNGTEAEVHCVQPIHKIDKEKPNVTISYIEQLDVTSKRQEQLSGCYYFRCTCERCTNTQLDNEKLSSKCPVSNCSGRVVEVEKVLMCKACKKEDFSDSYRDERNSALRGIIKELDELKDIHKQGDFQQSLTKCETLMAECSPTLHTDNVYVVQTTDVAMDACIHLGLWEKAILYGRRLVQAYKEYYSDYHPTTGVLLMKIGKILLYEGGLEEALQSLQQAERILDVTHGSGHELCRDLSELMIQCIEQIQGQLSLAQS